MPVLAAFLGSAFGIILDFFLKYFTRKVAMIAAMITAITALTAGLLIAFTGILAAIAVSTPEWISNMAAFVPGNAKACLSAYASAAILKWTYDWNAGFIQRTLF